MDLRKQQNEAWAQETVKEGINLLREGQIEKAIKKYTNAIEISPICADAFVARGAALANLEDYKKAITDFKIALKMNPDHPNAKKYLETTKEKKKLKKQEKKALMKGDYVMEIDAPTTALNLIVSEENNSKNKFKSNSLSTEVEGNEKNRKYVKRLRSDDGY
ncbi:Tetratricopeptide repeat protein 14 [Lobulomyces angularis]|nr:Tetratricopeptide repeat protein 14 [Lobulomyces angularis]